MNICTWAFASKENLSLITPEPPLCPYWQQKCMHPPFCRQRGQCTTMWAPARCVSKAVKWGLIHYYVCSVTFFFTLTYSTQPSYLLTRCGLHSLACGWVLRSRQVSAFCKGSELIKTIIQIVVTNLNTFVNLDLKYCITFCDSQRNRWQESNLGLPFSYTYMSYNKEFISNTFCNLNICHCSLPQLTCLLPLSGFFAFCS